jgi:hypothetical protein
MNLLIMLLCPVSFYYPPPRPQISSSAPYSLHTLSLCPSITVTDRKASGKLPYAFFLYFFTNFVSYILENSAWREYMVKIRFACYGQCFPFGIPNRIYVLNALQQEYG